jgi:hypothetical protein
LPQPTFNHTREDSPLTPCPECAALMASDPVNHPAHYGGGDNPYEVIKVITAWGLDFSLGNAVKYIARAGKTADTFLQDLKKARFYLDHVINGLESTETLKAHTDLKTSPKCMNCGHTHYRTIHECSCGCRKPEYASPD